MEFNGICKRHILKYRIFMEKLDYSELPVAINPLFENSKYFEIL